MNIKLGNEQLTLLPEKCAYLEKAAALILADLHLGKEHALMDKGTALPGPHSHSDQQKILRLLNSFKCRELVVLGDFIHTPRSATIHQAEILEPFISNLESLGCKAYLVPGNHDRLQVSFWERLGLMVIPEGELYHGFFLFHEPPPSEAGPWLAGHIHPVVHLKGSARDRLRLPCFWQTGAGLVLPSFGGLTGGHPIQAAISDQIYVSNGQGVVLVQ